MMIQQAARRRRFSEFPCWRNRHGGGIDRCVDHRRSGRATGLVENPAARALPDFGQLLERIHHGFGCRLSHLAARLVGQRPANLVHHVCRVSIGKPQRPSGCRPDTGESSGRQRHALAQ